MTHVVSHPSARFVPGQYRGKKMVARRQSNTTEKLKGKPSIYFPCKVSWLKSEN